MNNETTNRTPIGMWVSVSFANDPNEVLYRYISFGEYDEDSECDTYGVPDTQMFYYFDQSEVDSFMRAVEAKQDLYMVTDEWYIIIYDGVDYEYSED